MTPSLRRAFHQALDLVLDALAEDTRAANDTTKPKKRKPPIAKPLPPLPKDVTAAERKRIAEHLERQGFRPAG